MNQFKPIFLGTVDPSSEMATYKRVVNSQKCIRAGGKHNDLDDVGKDSYHHTMFEMLGTWSFGDYFKKDCIDWAWELLTEVYKLDKSRMYATYFQGDEALGLAADEEAKELWKQYLPLDKIIPSNAKDNFWEMGLTGPCGPCSEIHYDKIGGGYGDGKVNKDDPMVIEIWNLVFMQFNREEGGLLRGLPSRHIDTGMGLERLTAILQNQKANYDIDIFQNIFQAIEHETNSPSYSFKYGAEDINHKDTAYRVIADHIRTITFAISDGVLPSNTARGYVLRRIIRRAVRIGYEKLNAKVGFFSRLVRSVIVEMSDAFPELSKNPSLVEQIIRQEEEQFMRTLQHGLVKFSQEIEGKKEGFIITGDACAKLYHTFGFPLDLTKKMAEERGMDVDEKGYEEAMELTKKSEKKLEKASLALDVNSIALLNEKMIPTTNDFAKFKLEPIEATLKAIWNPKQSQFINSIDKINQNETEENNIFGLIFDSTNFYPEQGGQVFDTGKIHLGQSVFNVSDVQIYAGFIVHFGTIESGSFQIEQKATLEIDQLRRSLITVNHTSTHICNYALRKVLGEHVNQQGSLVLPEKFRFDFSHFYPLKSEELKEIDSTISSFVAKNYSVHYKEVPLEIAMKINGVRQMFDEKYPNPVRVVSIGQPVDVLEADPNNPGWVEFPIEFCGGTHLNNTNQVQFFTIVKEEPLAKGVRRLECLTGNEAKIAYENAEEFENNFNIFNDLKSPSGITQNVAKLINQLNELIIPYWRKIEFRERLDAHRGRAKKLAMEMEATTKRNGQIIGSKLVSELNSSPTTKFLIRKIDDGFSPSILKSVVTSVVKGSPSTPVMLISFDSEANKYSVVTMVSNVWMEKGLKANDWLNFAFEKVNGKSGGKNDCAQGTLDSSCDIHLVIKSANEFAVSNFN